MSLYVDVEKKLGSFRLKVKFEAENETFALLGPSGCGKSMTLKMIAGIERPDRGKIILDGVTLFDSGKRVNKKPQDRRAGYLFQQYALFPNMTVRDNIRCGIRRGVPREEEEKRIPEILEMMHLTESADLCPHALSGGQKQRTALARILVNDPQILMLDEPFSALDAHLRFSLEREVTEIIRSFGKTVLLISHDRDEVFRMSDRVALMENGMITAQGEKHAVFADPKTVSGARMTGCKNVSAAEAVAAHEVVIPAWGLKLQTAEDTSGVTHAGIRMHDIHLVGTKYEGRGGSFLPRNEASGYAEGTAHVLPAPDAAAGKNGTKGGGTVTDGTRARNIFRCTVKEAVETPFSYTVLLLADGGTEPFIMELEKPVWESMRLESVAVEIPPEGVLLLREPGDREPGDGSPARFGKDK